MLKWAILLMVPSLTNVNVKFLEYPNNSYWKTQHSSVHCRINLGLGTVLIKPYQFIVGFWNNACKFSNRISYDILKKIYKFSFNIKGKGLKLKYSSNISRDKLQKLKTENHAFILMSHTNFHCFYVFTHFSFSHI